jgi:hypothetical protein
MQTTYDAHGGTSKNIEPSSTLPPQFWKMHFLKVNKKPTNSLTLSLLMPYIYMELLVRPEI